MMNPTHETPTRHCGLKVLAKAAVQDKTPRSVAFVTGDPCIDTSHDSDMSCIESRSDFYKTRRREDTWSNQRLVWFVFSNTIW